MPNWSNVLKEISAEGSKQFANRTSPHDVIRRRYLRKLFNHTRRNVIAYYSGYLSKPVQGIEINDEDKNGYMLCVHEMDRAAGLDLILHTPGGDGQATVSLVAYLRNLFGDNIRAIVPQIAMSAGTMIACSSRSIVMGKQSSLGPVDPQFGAIPAANMLAEVKRAQADILANPNMAAFWAPILSRVTPSFIEKCEQAIRDSNEFLERTLRQNMLKGLSPVDQDAAVAKIAEVFANNEGRAHNTHYDLDKCLEVGLNIERLEDDQTLQDLVLTIHHCYMHTLMNTPAFKIIENHMGKALVKSQQPQLIAIPQAIEAQAEA
jgi:hypothetical protein